jgi:hypothetical protein
MANSGMGVGSNSLHAMLNKARAMNIATLMQYAPPGVGIRLTGESFTADSGHNYVSPNMLDGDTAMLSQMVEPDEQPLDLAKPESWPDWAFGLTDGQVRAVAQTHASPEKRAYIASGYRQMNTAEQIKPTRVRRPDYVSPSDRGEAGDLIIETQPEAMSPEERKKRQQVPVPLDAETNAGPVQFTDVTDDLSHTRPLDVVKRARGAAGTRGYIRKFRGRPLDT